MTPVKARRKREARRLRDRELIDPKGYAKFLEVCRTPEGQKHLATMGLELTEKGMVKP